MSTEAARLAVGERLREAFGKGYVVYDAGVEVVKTPCVVVIPGDPYLSPTTMGMDANVNMSLMLWLVTNRVDAKAAIAHLEEMRKTAADAVKGSGVPRGRWASASGMGVTEVGGQQFASLVIDTLFVVADD